MPDYRKLFFNLSLNLRRAVLWLTIKLANYSGNYLLKFIQSIWKLWHNIVISLIRPDANILGKSSSSISPNISYNNQQKSFSFARKNYRQKRRNFETNSFKKSHSLTTTNDDKYAGTINKPVITIRDQPKLTQNSIPAQKSCKSGDT